MEEPVPNPEVVESTQSKINNNLKKILIALAIILVVLIILGIVFYLFMPKSGNNSLIPQVQITSPSNLPSDAIVAKVGSENLYKIDLDYYLSTYFPGQNYTPKDQALDKMIDDSIILQEGQRQGFIALSSSTFNSPSKDIASRSALIEQASKKLQLKEVKNISGEIVSIWFNNADSYPAPSIGVAKAKEIVKAKIDKIYQNIKTGSLTMAQAGQQIRSDSSLKSIDPSYQGNAYSRFTNLTSSQQLFNDEAANNLVWSLGKNGLSEILLISDYDNNHNQFEALYSVVRVTNAEGSMENFSQFISNLRSKYEIIRY